MKFKVPKGYRSKNLEDRRGEFKRAPVVGQEGLTKLGRAGARMEENLNKMGTRAAKNVLTKRTDANIAYATGKGGRINFQPEKLPRKKR